MLKYLPHEGLILHHRQKTWSGRGIRLEEFVVLRVGLHLGERVFFELEAIPLVGGADFVNVEAVLDDRGKFRGEGIVINGSIAGEIKLKLFACATENVAR